MTTIVPMRALAGPDTGWVVRLVPGFHWLGRATIAPSIGIPIDDRTVEPHHAIIEVAGDGSVSLLQTSGRSAIRVGGRPVDDGWTPVRTPAEVLVGAALLSIGHTDTRPTEPAGNRSVLAPLRADGDELDRFERDLMTAMRPAVPPPPGSVVLGIGERRRAIALVGGDGEVATPGDLDHRAHSVYDRVTRSTGPVVVRLTDRCRMAIDAPDPDRVLRSIGGQLDAVARARLLVIDADDLVDFDDLAEIGRPVLVTMTGGDLPPGCTALLTVGDTWQATWWPDLETAPTALHAAGVSARREGLPADARWPFVVEQVARADAELGRRVVGVPEPARRE